MRIYEGAYAVLWNVSIPNKFIMKTPIQTRSNTSIRLRIRDLELRMQVSNIPPFFLRLKKASEQSFAPFMVVTELIRD